MTKKATDSPKLCRSLRTIGFPTSETTPKDTTEAQANIILSAFLAKLEAFLGKQANALNYTELWEQTKPELAYPPLSIFLNRTYPTLISKEQTKNVRTPFYADYGAVHDGRLPFVDPVPLVRYLCLLAHAHTLILNSCADTLGLR